MNTIKPRFYGFMSTWLYLPISELLKEWRKFSRKLRRKKIAIQQETKLEKISWIKCTNHYFTSVWESHKADGNVRLSEVGIINTFARNCEDFTNLFEIGTFDGRTTLNLAFSSPENCKVFTLDLKKEMLTEYNLDNGEKRYVDKESSGERIKPYKDSNNLIAKKIEQIYDDSATFDFSTFYDTCSLVFVDGSHVYDYVLSDSLNAIKMVNNGGVILWHDYGIWDGVT
ncbi:MAG: class I SAM-dependent methyltransferase [Methylomonas sp.]|nr:class I SAM-dependent methyltransferase [Methylomonas sp.]